jgi:hypothetical protein
MSSSSGWQQLQDQPEQSRDLVHSSSMPDLRYKCPLEEKIPPTTPKRTAPLMSLVSAELGNPQEQVFTSDSSDPMACNMLAHEYFSSHQEGRTKAWEPPVGSTEQACKAVLADYTLLCCCKSSGKAFSQLTHNLFFDPKSLFVATSIDGQPSAVKMGVSAIDIKDERWLPPPHPESGCTTTPSPFGCTFWLRSLPLGQEVARGFDFYTFVLGGHLVFPYLTVEFRNDQEEMEGTELRAAYSDTQSLFNRYRLYIQAFKKTLITSTTKDAPHCHFVIIFNKEKYKG